MSLPTKAWYSVAVSDEKEHNSTTVIAILPKVIPQLQKLVARYLNYHMFTTGPTAVHLNNGTEQCFSVPNGTTLRRGTTKRPATELVGLQTYG